MAPKTLELKHHDVKTMRDARGYHYEIFNGSNDEEIGKKEAILKYIEDLGQRTGVDVGDFELSSFVKDGHIILNRAQINKIFFGLKRKTKKLPKERYVKAAEIKSAVAEFVYDPTAMTFKLATERMLVATDLRNARNTVRKLEERYNEINQEILAQQNQPSAEDSSLKWTNEIKKVLATGKFTMHKVQRDGVVTFLSKFINKSFFSEAQATNLIVPLGRFKVDVIPDKKGGWTISVGAGEDNITIGQYVHPHIGVKNYICMGEIGNSYHKNYAKRDFYACMMDLYDVMANFEERKGYIPLYQFEQAYKAKTKGVKNG